MSENLSEKELKPSCSNAVSAERKPTEDLDPEKENAFVILGLFINSLRDSSPIFLLKSLKRSASTFSFRLTAILMQYIKNSSMSSSDLWGLGVGSASASLSAFVQYARFSADGATESQKL